MSDREDLAALVRELAVVHGKVTLSSGKEADYYVDLRRATLHHKAAPLIGSLLRELVADWDFDAVGGLTMGADPVAMAVMHAPGRPIDAFVVRKAAKAHGMQRQIEGPGHRRQACPGCRGHDHDGQFAVDSSEGPARGRGHRGRSRYGRRSRDGCGCGDRCRGRRVPLAAGPGRSEPELTPREWLRSPCISSTTPQGSVAYGDGECFVDAVWRGIVVVDVSENLTSARQDEYGGEG